MSDVPIPIKTEEVILESTEYNSTEELEEELQLQLEDSGGETYHIQYSEPQVSQSGTRQRHQNSNMSSNGAGGATNAKNSNSSFGGSAADAPTSPTANKNVLESEKRMRREIANSNERRRMQSINAGFQNLRSLLPRHEGEKLSKAAILQQTSQYICELETQKTQLLAQNSQLKRQLGQHESSSAASGDATNTQTADKQPGSGIAFKKRKLTDNVINIQTISDSSDEGLGSMSPEPTTLLNGAANQKAAAAALLAHNSSKELLETKKQLDKERRMRNLLEEELRLIKQQLYSVATAPPASGSSYIPREVIEHTDNIVRDHLDDLPAGSVSYVEIDEVTGQQQVVVCSSIEELESEAAAAADIITEDNVHEEVILSTTSSTESEHEVNVSAIAKAYAEGASTTVLQPILQAAIKATPKVEVERINETTIMKVKTEKIDQPSGLTRSRQNLETIVEAIRHLEGDHLFGEVAEQHKLQQQKAQEAPLALTTTKQQQAQRTTLAELRPFLQLKGNKHVTIVGGSGAALTLTHQQLAAATKAQQKDSSSGCNTATVTPTAIFKVQATPHVAGSGAGTSGSSQQVTITTTALKQCRPGVIVAKQLS